MCSRDGKERSLLTLLGSVLFKELLGSVVVPIQHVPVRFVFLKYYSTLFSRGSTSFLFSCTVNWITLVGILDLSAAASAATVATQFQSDWCQLTTVAKLFTHVCL